MTEALDLIQDAMVNEQLESKQISTSS
jgi:hypothetical protein